MQGYKLALCFDSKEEYLQAGLSEEEVAELDSQETVARLIHTPPRAVHPWRSLLSPYLEPGMNKTGVDLLVGALTQIGHRVECVRGGRRLAGLLASGRRWDIIFNISEGLYSRCREAQVPALCELFAQPFTFSDATTCAVTLDKELAKRIVRDGGVPTPRFIVVDEIDRLGGLLKESGLEPPLFAKPVAEGNSKGVTQRSLVLELGDLPALCRELMVVYRQPILIEEYLEGRELTVGVIGNGPDARVLGVMEIGLEGAAEATGYTATNKRELKSRLSFRLIEDAGLAQEAEAISLASYRLLRCRDGARIDLRCDRAGAPCFLEVNALPGLHPEKSDLPRLASLQGISYTELLGQILQVAHRRIGDSRRSRE